MLMSNRLPDDVWSGLEELDEAFVDSTREDETKNRYSSFENFVRNPPFGLRLDKYDHTSFMLPQFIASIVERLTRKHSNIQSKTRTLAFLVHYGTIKLLLTNKTFRELQAFVKTIDPLMDAMFSVAPSLIEFYDNLLTEKPPRDVLGINTVKVTYRPLRYFSPQGEPKSSAYEILTTSSEPILHPTVAITYAITTALLDSEVWVPRETKTKAKLLKTRIEQHIAERIEKIKNVLYDSMKILIYTYPHHKNDEVFIKDMKLLITRLQKYYPSIEMKLHNIPVYSNIKKELFGSDKSEQT